MKDNSASGLKTEITTMSSSLTLAPDCNVLAEENIRSLTFFPLARTRLEDTRSVLSQRTHDSTPPFGTSANQHEERNQNKIICYKLVSEVHNCSQIWCNAHLDFSLDTSCGVLSDSWRDPEGMQKQVQRMPKTLERQKSLVRLPLLSEKEKQLFSALVHRTICVRYKIGHKNRERDFESSSWRKLKLETHVVHFSGCWRTSRVNDDKKGNPEKENISTKTFILQQVQVVLYEIKKTILTMLQRTINQGYSWRGISAWSRTAAEDSTQHRVWWRSEWWSALRK